ncbi:hypothetical protein BDQ17DRAFT_1431430 [Cyathus striatus]|nr:hypothetical protein BDQ17DRAFT_1431430 [Cyathus striatus]
MSSIDNAKHAAYDKISGNTHHKLYDNVNTTNKHIQSQYGVSFIDNKGSQVPMLEPKGQNRQYGYGTPISNQSNGAKDTRSTSQMRNSYKKKLMSNDTGDKLVTNYAHESNGGPKPKQIVHNDNTGIEHTQTIGNTKHTEAKCVPTAGNISHQGLPNDQDSNSRKLSGMFSELAGKIAKLQLKPDDLGRFKYKFEGYELEGSFKCHEGLGYGLEIKIKSDIEADICKPRNEHQPMHLDTHMEQVSPHYTGQSIMRTKPPKTTLANEVKAYFIDLLVKNNVPLGGTGKKQLPWTTLTKILSDHNLEIVNWPEGVPLPGSKDDTSDDNKGIKGMRLEMLQKLHTAIRNKTNPVDICVKRNTTPQHENYHTEQWNYNGYSETAPMVYFPDNFNNDQNYNFVCANGTSQRDTSYYDGDIHKHAYMNYKKRKIQNAVDQY